DTPRPSISSGAIPASCDTWAMAEAKSSPVCVAGSGCLVYRSSDAPMRTAPVLHANVAPRLVRKGEPPKKRRLPIQITAAGLPPLPSVLGVTLLTNAVIHSPMLIQQYREASSQKLPGSGR